MWYIASVAKDNGVYEPEEPAPKTPFLFLDKALLLYNNVPV